MLDTLLQLPPVRCIESVLNVEQFGHAPFVAGGKRFLQSVETAQQLTGFIERGRDRFKDGTREFARDFLREAGNLDALAAIDGACIGPQSPLEELEQRRLPAAVTAEQADPFTGANLQGDIVV